MAEGRMQDAWSRWSSLMALIANVNRDPKKKRQPFKPAEFDPTQHKPKKPLQVGIGVLKRVFIDSRR